MALKVIGAGFGRTGTMSLKAALERLGFGPCYHMVECFPRGPEHWRLWTEAAAGNPDWEAIFDGFTATVDFPACTSYRALADHYPEAKVILSVRDPASWFDSTQETIFSPAWIEWLDGSEAADYMRATINDYFDGRMHDREHLVQRFEQHVASVKAAIAPERLLVFEARQGWEPLCAFLDCPVPDEPFPRVNDAPETKAIIEAIMSDGFATVFGFEPPER
jgi:hypothetical protein